MRCRHPCGQGWRRRAPSGRIHNIRENGLRSLLPLLPPEMAAIVFRGSGGLRFATDTREAAMSRAQVFGLLLFASQAINPSLAQERGPSPAESPTPYPSGTNITFQWIYSCSNARVCAFNCPGAGGAINVKSLAISLGTIPVGNSQQSAIFYEFSTLLFSRANGFSISAGLSVLACQVNGMVLEYSGPPQRTPNEPPKEESPLPKKTPSSDEVARTRSGK